MWIAVSSGELGKSDEVALLPAAAPSPAITPGPVVAVIPVIGIGPVITRRPGIDRAFNDFFLFDHLRSGSAAWRRSRAHADVAADDEAVLAVHKIGRASCRERVLVAV